MKKPGPRSLAVNKRLALRMAAIAAGGMGPLRVTHASGFDQSFALEQAGGDECLLGDLIELFVNNAPGQLQRVQDGLDHGDWQSTERSAHTLKGSVSHFLDPKALAPLHELERLSKAGRLVGARELFASVKALIDDLLTLMSETIRRPAELVLSPQTDSMRFPYFEPQRVDFMSAQIDVHVSMG